MPGRAERPQAGPDRTVERPLGERDHRQQRRPVPGRQGRPGAAHRRAARGDRDHREAAGPADLGHAHPLRTGGAEEGPATEGYPTQAERFAKQRRLQSLRAEISRVIADRDESRVRVTEGGRRRAKTRHYLQAARLTVARWREAWEAARWRIEAIGSGDEPFGNLTITVIPDGQASIRLPRPLEHLANARRGRYLVSGNARFAYRKDEWLDRITGGKTGLLHNHPQARTRRRVPHRRLGHQTRAARPRPADIGFRGACQPGRSWQWTLTTGTSRSAGSTHTATRPGGLPASSSASPGAQPPRCPGPARHHPPHPLRPAARHHRHRGRGPELRRRPRHRPGDDGPRPARAGGSARPWPAIPTAVFRSGLTAQTHRHGITPVRGQPRLHLRMGRPALAKTIRERHPARGSRHRDRAPRPGPQGPATGRCDTHAASGPRRESYRPGRAKSAPGDYR